MAPDAAATGGEQGESPAAAAKTKAGPRLGGRGDGRGHAIQSQRKQMCESGRESREDHADCHGMSCFVMVRSPLRPFAPARGSFTRHRASFRSMIDGVPPEAGERHCFARIACAPTCGCARPFRGGARIARLIARVRSPAPACARRPRERRGRHEMSRSGARSGRFRRSGSFVHGASRLLSFNGPGRPPEPEERHCFARVACARVRACIARDRFAAVRVSRARLPARARARGGGPDAGHTYPACSRRSVCSAPAIASLRRKAERRPRKPPLSRPL